MRKKKSAKKFEYIIFDKSNRDIREIPNESVDCIVTSPPYKNSDGFKHKMILEAFKEAYRILRYDRAMFVNFGHLKEDKARPFQVVTTIQEIGFKLHDTIIWEKNHYTPLRGNNLNNVFEYVFFFTKGDCPNLDRLAVGRPYTDKSNVDRYGGGKDLTCGGNIWKIPYETIQKSTQKNHPDRFPVALPERCLKLVGAPKHCKTVVDIFGGSMTTGVAAARLGCRKFYGIEIDRERAMKGRQRLMAEK